MSLLIFRNIVLNFGQPPLLDGVSFTIEPNERLCLVGRNGAGKSTCLKLAAGEILPDSGEIVRAQNLRVAVLEQDLPLNVSGTVFRVVASGVGAVGEMLEQYHAAAHRVADGDMTQFTVMEQCQHRLEAVGGWEMNQRIDAVISRLGLNPDLEVSALSGGTKRRVMLARALVSEPDLLLLDEPTNHLDIESITWLEEFLLNWRGTLMFVTHDRSFLQKLATRIVEIDRGRATDFPGDYATYIERKQALLAAEDTQNALFDKKLAQEEVWVRQGVKARRTRNEGRVRALERLRREHAERRNLQGRVRMSVSDAERSGRLVAEAENVDFEYNGRTVIRDLTTTIWRGDKVGIIGPNGAGKTTLLRLLLDALQPTRGTLRQGTNIQVAYFDQQRAALQEDKTVQYNVADGSETVMVNGVARHVLSYLQDFLFEPKRARQPVRSLSGGERNRLLLARLFLRPSNLLVLDEPTNDLDMDTLELLESMLVDYPGTVLVVSHDRVFLNNVVSSTLVFEGDARVNEYVGGYEDWIRQRATPSPATKPSATKPAAAPVKAAKKMSYKDQRELETLPSHIEALEKEQEALSLTMNAPEFFRQDKASIATVQARVVEIKAELARSYQRWQELEAK